MDSKGRFAADEPVRQTTEIQAVSHGTWLAHSSPPRTELTLASLTSESYRRERCQAPPKHRRHARLRRPDQQRELVGWHTLSALQADLFFAAGTLSSSTSRTSTAPTCAKSLLPCVTATSRTRASTAVFTSSTPPVTHCAPSTLLS